MSYCWEIHLLFISRNEAKLFRKQICVNLFYPRQSLCLHVLFFIRCWSFSFLLNLYFCCRVKGNFAIRRKQLWFASVYKTSCTSLCCVSWFGAPLSASAVNADPIETNQLIETVLAFVRSIKQICKLSSEILHRVLSFCTFWGELLDQWLYSTQVSLTWLVDGSTRSRVILLMTPSPKVFTNKIWVYDLQLVRRGIETA